MCEVLYNSQGNVNSYKSGERFQFINGVYSTAAEIYGSFMNKACYNNGIKIKKKRLNLFFNFYR